VSESASEVIEARVARLEHHDEQLTRALELLTRHEAAPGPKAGRDWDAYAAVIASFIGLLALAVSGYTAYVQRQQLRAQVWPHLYLSSSDSTNPTVSVTNQGTGPARVTAMRVTVNSAPVRTWWDVQKAAGYSGEEGLVMSSLGGEAVIPPGKDVTIVQPIDNEQSRAKFRELLPGGKHVLAMTVCYCSVLDECWIVSMDDKARPSDTCPIASSERFTE
jgi:hypothetical protein